MSDDVGALIGLPAAEAQARAEAMGLLVRVLSNDPDQAVTLEWRSDRVNFKVDDGKVVEAWKG